MIKLIKKFIKNSYGDVVAYSYADIEDFKRILKERNINIDLSNIQQQEENCLNSFDNQYVYIDSILFNEKLTKKEVVKFYSIEHHFAIFKILKSLKKVKIDIKKRYVNNSMPCVYDIYQCDFVDSTRNGATIKGINKALIDNKRLSDKVWKIFNEKYFIVSDDFKCIKITK